MFVYVLLIVEGVLAPPAVWPAGWLSWTAWLTACQGAVSEPLLFTSNVDFNAADTPGQS